MFKGNGIRWTSIVQYFDVDTGEEIPKQEIKKYTIIKTTKYATFNELKTRGTIKHTKLCKRSQQGTLW